jgi:hypothetical protein
MSVLWALSKIEAVAVMPSKTNGADQPGDRLVAAIEAQTVAIGRAMDRCVLTLLAAVTAGVVIMVLIAG